MGPTHGDAEVELLKAAARQRLVAGQGEPGLGPQPAGAGAGAARCRSRPGRRGRDPVSATGSSSNPGTRSVNRALEARARALGGVKGQRHPISPPRRSATGSWPRPAGASRNSYPPPATTTSSPRRSPPHHRCHRSRPYDPPSSANQDQQRQPVCRLARSKSGVRLMRAATPWAPGQQGPS